MKFWRRPTGRLFLFACGILLTMGAPKARAQAALFLEQPYGVFGTLNPTGHAAIYLEHVCAETPVHLRPCQAGETGVVISRYKGMEGYDWLAIPLIPYLYSVDDPAQVPREADQEMVDRMRAHYKEARLGDWGENLPKGNFFYDGWVELVGTAYDRRTYAFRFETTREQDARLIARLNDRPNKSHFNILFNNCADFDRFVLGDYLDAKFKRNILPDAGITTPKRVAWNLAKYAKKHPEVQLTVLEIPQVPGFRRKSHSDRGVAETFFTNGYILPVVILNPYVAGGLLADYLVQGRYKLIPKHLDAADAHNLTPLLAPERLSDENGETVSAPSPAAPPEPSGSGAKTMTPVEPGSESPPIAQPSTVAPLVQPTSPPLGL